jgi:hypothetical protein
MTGPAFDEGLILPLATEPHLHSVPHKNGSSAGNGAVGQFRFVNGKVYLSVPTFGSLEGKWEPEERERQAAWELYIEIITHTSIAEFEPTERALGETLMSLDALYSSARDILRKYGPEIARSNARSNVSFAAVAIAAINHVLEPILSRWYPLVRDYHSARPPSISSVDWEAQWDRTPELRKMLDGARQALIEYADVLALVAKIAPLHRGSIAAGGNGANGHR